MNKNTRTLAIFAALVISLPILQGCAAMVVAGAGTAVMASIDRRTYGAQVDDSDNELRNSADIGNRFGDKVDVTTTSFNRWVLLTGTVPTEEIKAEVGKMTSKLPAARQVINDIQVGPVAPSFSSYTSDATITTKVKSRLLNAKEVPSANVKVVTEMGKVYMMGLLTEAEAKYASLVARRTEGVRSVVMSFEIISVAEARRLDPAIGSDQSAPAAN